MWNRLYSSNREPGWESLLRVQSLGLICVMPKSNAFYRTVKAGQDWGWARSVSKATGNCKRPGLFTIIQNQYFHSIYTQCQVGCVRLQAERDSLYDFNQLAGTTAQDMTTYPLPSRTQYPPWLKKHAALRRLGWPGSSLSEAKKCVRV